MALKETTKVGSPSPQVVVEVNSDQHVEGPVEKELPLVEGAQRVEVEQGLAIPTTETGSCSEAKGFQLVKPAEKKKKSSSSALDAMPTVIKVKVKKPKYVKTTKRIFTYLSFYLASNALLLLFVARPRTRKRFRVVLWLYIRKIIIRVVPLPQLPTWKLIF